MSDELTASAGRVRRVKAGELIADVYADCVDMPGHVGTVYLSEVGQLADAYLAERTWTKTPTTVEGWYWWRNSTRDRHCVRRVGKFGVLLVDYDSHEAELVPLDSVGGEWYGPLTPPG